MKIFRRFQAAFLAAKVCFKTPDIMGAPHFVVLAGIYENILKVQERKSPLMFQIGIVFPENEKHIIATVWIGAGADSSPVKRIEELYNENQELKRIIKTINNETTLP